MRNSVIATFPLPRSASIVLSGVTVLAARGTYVLVLAWARNSDVDVLVQESYSRMNLTQVGVCDSQFRALVLSVREDAWANPTKSLTVSEDVWCEHTATSKWRRRLLRTSTNACTTAVYSQKETNDDSV